jgi:Helix-turn-helix domain
MQMFEWGIASNATGQPGLHPVGITGSAPDAQTRMLEALVAVPARILARGWVTALDLGADRLTYDRLAMLVRVTRDADGAVQWLAGTNPSRRAARAAGHLADHPPLLARMTVIDGRQLRELRRARGLSRERLAWKAGLCVGTLARLESQPRPQCLGRTLTVIAEVLGENPRALVSDLPPDRGESPRPDGGGTPEPRPWVVGSSAGGARTCVTSSDAHESLT